MPYTIFLDPGHGGSDPGAVYKGRQEKDDVLRLTMAVGDILSNSGYRVLYSRTTDVYESPIQKANEANNANADLFVSIHRNSNPTPNSASGVEVLVHDASGLKLEMAQAITEELVNVGYVDLGVKERPNLIVLRRTKMPALLVEVGFINSDADNQLFDDEFNAIARGIADGIMNTIENYGEAPGNREMPENREMFGNGPMPRNGQMPGNGKMPENGQIPGDGISPGNGIYPDDEEFPDNIGNLPVRYHVQVGTFRNRGNAERLFNELISNDYPAEIMAGDDGFYRVQVGSFTSLDEASRMERRLKQAGYPTIIIR